MTKTEPAGAGRTEPGEAQVTKADLEAIRKEKEALEKRLVDVESENKQNKEALAKERDERLTKEYVEKAARELPFLGDSKELGLLLKSLAFKAPEELVKLEGILKAANERIEQGDLFKELGTSRGPSAGSAEDKLTSIAKAYVEKGVVNGYPEAFKKACEDNPGLYRQYVTEQRGR